MKFDLPDQHHLRSAQGYVSLGMWLEANAELESVQPRCRILPEVLRLRLVVYHATKKWDLLEVVAGRLSEYEPENIQWVISQAYAVRRARSIENAKSIFLQARNRFPNEPLIYYNLACYYCVMGDLDEAKQHLIKTFAIDPQWRLRALEDEDLQPLWSAL